MADIICRWRNGTPKTVMELVNKLPHQKMNAVLFRKEMETIWPNFFRAPYQLACQLALYCESEDGFYYPRFDHDIDIKEASAYLEHWINRYYIPNPYTGNDGFLDLPCPTYVIKSLYDYVLNNPNCNYADAYKACFHDDASNNDDIVRNYINRFSKVLSFSKTGKLNKTEVDPQIIFGFMDKNSKKEFFDNFARPKEWCLMEVYNRVDISKRQQMFFQYMKEQKKLMESSCRQYAYTHATNTEVIEIVDQVTHKTSLFEVIDIMAIQSIYNKVMALDTNKKRNNALSATIFNYKQFIDYLESEKIGTVASSESDIIINPDSKKIGESSSVLESALDFEKKSFKPSQTIYYGAPGTGKSHTIKKKEKECTHCIRTTFHPDSDYATFVGCYKPHRNHNTGELTYEFVEQAFLETYLWAWMHPMEECILVIEEINRGNCAQVFGDIFQLLDRDEDGWSTYPIKADTDISNHLANLSIAGYGEMMTQRYGKDKTGYNYLALPPNMSILATMNTSDQSLFPIDSAFKRRWDWKYIKITEGKDKDTKKPLRWKILVNDAQDNKVRAYDWWRFLQRMNDIIYTATESADKQMGYFFVKATKHFEGTKVGEIGKDGKYVEKDPVTMQMDYVTADTFVNKVLFYLWTDIMKDNEYTEIIDLMKKDGKQLKFPEFFDEAGESINSDALRTFLDNVMKEEEVLCEVMEKMMADEETDDGLSEQDLNENGGKRNFTKVTFSDGTVIDEGDRFATYVAALKKFGLEKSAEIGETSKLHRHNLPLICKNAQQTPPPPYSYVMVDGVYIMKGTNSMHRMLIKIGKELNVSFRLD